MTNVDRVRKLLQEYKSLSILEISRLSELSFTQAQTSIYHLRSLKQVYISGHDVRVKQGRVACFWSLGNLPDVPPPKVNKKAAKKAAAARYRERHRAKIRLADRICRKPEFQLSPFSGILLGIQTPR
jgi:hypothetical protein